ncbi:hypothetical protein [Kordia jejudonensis]|uniref:hypothetical protein n=1 Tax=Kordia jejudonensis TaxID=1348245 RepID=UPI0012E096E6|nr:hypothetical protein [Kordia jejudonensis]
MKINLKNSKNQLSRDEMKTIIAGNGAFIQGDGAYVLCNNGDEVAVNDCSEMDKACEGSKGGAKICSGGGN